MGLLVRVVEAVRDVARFKLELWSDLGLQVLRE